MSSYCFFFFFFFSSRRRHTRLTCDWSSDVCSSDLVNKFISEAEASYQPLRVDPAIEEEQAKRLAGLRAARDSDEWRRRIDELKRAAAGTENVLVPLRSALAAQATVGEVCDALRDVWGIYRPPDI